MSPCMSPSSFLFISGDKNWEVPLNLWMKMTWKKFDFFSLNNEIFSLFSSSLLCFSPRACTHTHAKSYCLRFFQRKKLEMWHFVSGRWVSENNQNFLLVWIMKCSFFSSSSIFFNTYANVHALARLLLLCLLLLKEQGLRCVT